MTGRTRIAAVTFAVAGATLMAQQGAPRAATFVVALPKVTPMPVTATSHPWLYYKATQRPLEEVLVVVVGPADVEEELVEGRGLHHLGT